MKASLYFLGILSIFTQNLQTAYGSDHAAALKLEPGKCLKIDQTSHTVGVETILLSSNALKACGEHNKFVLYAKAPDWHVCFANLITKKYYQCPAEKFQSKHTSFLKKFVGQMYRDYELKNLKPGAIVGIPVSCYDLVRKPNTKDDFNFKVDNGSYCIITNPKMDKRIGLILAQLYSLPITDGIPMRLIRCDKKHERIFELETYKANLIPVKSIDFEMPKNLSRCKTIDEVYEDNTNLNNIQDLF